MTGRCRLFVVLSAMLVAGCGRDAPPSMHRPTFPDPGPGKSDIVVLTATTFLFHGQKCQLLGVAEPDDAVGREQALDFTKRWFDSIGNCIGMYNASNPLQLEDGTSVVWARGYDTYLSCLNLELVRAGLVKVDYHEWNDYSFTEPGKDRDYVADWRGDLDSARRAHDAGEKSKVLFQWPPGKESVEH